MTGPAESWKSDVRVRYLLERNIDEDEQIRLTIEGMDGQCIIALDERLMVIKPGSVIDETYTGLVTSVRYIDVTGIKVREDSSNRVIEIITSNYHVSEAHTGQGPPESNFFLSDEPNTIPIAKWTLNKQKAYLIELSELIREAKERPKSTEAQ